MKITTVSASAQTYDAGVAVNLSSK